MTMSTPQEYTLSDTSISTLSVYDLLKHTSDKTFVHNQDFQSIYPLTLAINTGAFTKTNTSIKYPIVYVIQSGTSLMTSCSCGQGIHHLCEHQTEVIACILEKKNYRIFFDKEMRHRLLLPSAKEYGLEGETHLESYFQVTYQDGKIHIQPSVKELLKVDEPNLQQQLLPQRKPKLSQNIGFDAIKRQILVISKHRYYNHLHFLLMEASTTQSGKIKNPIDNVDPMPLIWHTQHPSEIKFYTALLTFLNKYSEDLNYSEWEALKLIVQNPLELDAYYHDRNVADNISTKSLVPVELNIIRAEIRLTVLKKEPFYEITGELVFNDLSLPFKQVVIKNECFILHQHQLLLPDNPDILRVLKFFKAHNEILLIHSSKYENFVQTILSPLERYIHIHYSYIHTATPAQLAEKTFDIQRIVYLQQEGNYISITPVLKYGDVEVVVYSQKQLLDTDQNGNVFKIERNREAEIQLTTIVMQQHADFKEQINEHEYFYLHRDKFLDYDWFLEAFDAWRKENITILGFNELKNNSLNPYRAKINIQVISGMDWFNAKLKVRFGKKEASLKQFHRAIRNKSKFVQLDDGTKGILPDEWITKITQYFQVGDIDDELLKIPKINFTEVASLFEKEVLSEEVQAEIDLYTQKLGNSKEIPVVPVPKDLKAELRNYQYEGLNWLNFLDGFNFGGCLADDMGLGKTVQIIAFILSQREKQGHCTNLIVVPTSLLFNWQEEIARFAPSLSVYLHYGSDRPKDIQQIEKYEVILTSYGLLLSDIRFLKTFRFNYIFLDESQAIKNPDSERYKAARLLQSRNRIVLTGTPIENNTFDLYGQLSFACPGLLGSKQYFKDTYALPIDKFEFSKRAAELHQKIKPFILRRTKKQVAKELPEKTEMVIYCEMNAEQRMVYEMYERELREYISATDEEEIQKDSMHVLTGLTKLRQICNSPILLKEGHSGAHAVKIEILLQQIENKSSEHKILVFSQFVGMLDLIKTELEHKDIPFEYLTGQTKDRGSKVLKFQTNEHIRVFLISLKAGGVGLNLTEADYVYLVDPWWNPATENQAIDRSYRIGQTKNVIAVRLICSDTIEEKIMNLQKKKSKLAQDLVRTDASLFNTLTKQDLLGILE